jgi:hypothetical protein
MPHLGWPRRVLGGVLNPCLQYPWCQSSLPCPRPDCGRIQCWRRRRRRLAQGNWTRTSGAWCPSRPRLCSSWRSSRRSHAATRALRQRPRELRITSRLPTPPRTGSTPSRLAHGAVSACSQWPTKASPPTGVSSQSSGLTSNRHITDLATNPRRRCCGVCCSPSGVHESRVK